MSARESVWDHLRPPALRPTSQLVESLHGGGRSAVRAAWYYPDPAQGYEDLRDRVPGGFYGGWITPELDGPFKGAPGTRGW